MMLVRVSKPGCTIRVVSIVSTMGLRRAGREPPDYRRIQTARLMKKENLKKEIDFRGIILIRRASHRKRKGGASFRSNVEICVCALGPWGKRFDTNVLQSSMPGVSV